MKLTVVAGVLLACGVAKAAEPLIGRASVVDGDTIDIGKTRVRFSGVDAPESWQRCRDGDGGEYRCGHAAAMALDRFLAASRPTRCELAGRDRDRRIGTCFRADGTDVNRWLVENGHALEWPKYSKGAYADAQRSAQSNGLGIWRGEFQLPCEVRAKRWKREARCD
ncbi:thermonuclease family protein [Ensifer sp. PDNC004]|uniref:thermonuclease family protein n=1 Tax=Ensifer sp. PDNC004 TaxID=2811423 RepID=UPI001963B587|nr:thermonuclease family protein [Ensifer sp. PDNC004]QRY70173.1 thermonuclease family protein [Ensifer sp. PDNC004]